MDLYWVAPSLAVASRPRGGDWLDDEMNDLRLRGVDVLVSCLVPSEELELDLTGESASAELAGLGFVRMQMEDRGTPSNAAAFEEVVRHLGEHISAGRRVAVHCRQGLGRSPLVVAAVLVRSGVLPEDAWNLVAEHRRQAVPETEEQRAWIQSFAGRRPLSSREASSAGRPRHNHVASAGGRGYSRP